MARTSTKKKADNFTFVLREEKTRQDGESQEESGQPTIEEKFYEMANSGLYQGEKTTIELEDDGRVLDIKQWEIALPMRATTNGPTPTATFAPQGTTAKYKAHRIEAHKLRL